MELIAWGLVGTAGMLVTAAWYEYRKAQRFAKEMQAKRDETIRVCTALYEQARAAGEEDSKCHS